MTGQVQIFYMLRSSPASKPTLRSQNAMKRIRCSNGPCKYLIGFFWPVGSSVLLMPYKISLCWGPGGRPPAKPAGRKPDDLVRAGLCSCTEGHFREIIRTSVYIQRLKLEIK